MNQHVAFLRAINVAGHAIVKMTALREAFMAAGCRSVRTYIQSGNVIFEAPEKNTAAVFQKVRVQLRVLLGHEPGILFRTIREVEGIVKGAPFQAFEAEPAIKLCVVFLSQKPRSKPRFPLVSPSEAVEAVGMKNLEVFIVSRRKKNGFYGFPNNFIEKQLGVQATTRNWSTILKIVELVRREHTSPGSLHPTSGGRRRRGNIIVPFSPMEIEKRMDRIERRLDATTKLIQHGMKMLAKFQDENRRAQDENRHAIQALIDAQQRAEVRQQRTEVQLDKLIVALLKRSPNGR